MVLDKPVPPGAHAARGHAAGGPALEPRPSLPAVLEPPVHATEPPVHATAAPPALLSARSSGAFWPPPPASPGAGGPASGGSGGGSGGGRRPGGPWRSKLSVQPPHELEVALSPSSITSPYASAPASPFLGHASPRRRGRSVHAATGGTTPPTPSEPASIEFANLASHLSAAPSRCSLDRGSGLFGPELPSRAHAPSLAVQLSTWDPAHGPGRHRAHPSPRGGLGSAWRHGSMPALAPAGGSVQVGLCGWAAGRRLGHASRLCIRPVVVLGGGGGDGAVRCGLRAPLAHCATLRSTPYAPPARACRRPCPMTVQAPTPASTRPGTKASPSGHPRRCCCLTTPLPSRPC